VDALVLSAGGMFGAWQAGAWTALERIFQPDLVVGASVGALNGWLIACGCPPAELEDRWRTLDAFTHFRWRIPPAPLEGFVDPRGVEELIRSLFEGREARLPFGVVATELATLRPRLFQREQITWRHLAASCAVLGVLPQYRLDGRRFSDGGLLGSLPLWAAVEMGADRIVAIQVLRGLPWPVSGAVAAIRAVARHSPPPLAGVKVLTLGPERSLGGLRDTLCWNRDNAKRWLREGREEGLRRADQVLEFLGAGGQPPVTSQGY
jgi:predicted acylesterase/phospholipase RssA